MLNQYHCRDRKELGDTDPDLMTLKNKIKCGLGKMKEVLSLLLWPDVTWILYTRKPLGSLVEGDTPFLHRCGPEPDVAGWVGFEKVEWQERGHSE